MSRRAIKQHQLERAIADATGEDFWLIRRRGFSLVDEPEVLGPRVLDWDSAVSGEPPAVYGPANSTCEVA